MTTEHLEILVEEPSMEAFLQAILPGLIGNRMSFAIYPYQGKDDLLLRLGERLRGYAAWLPRNWRILVVVDRDGDDCVELKRLLENEAQTARLSTRTSNPREWQVSFRIAIEELEGWYFGDWEAVRACYPRVAVGIPKKANYRDCDGILGGTWEAFERELQRADYFIGGLRKIEAARAVGANFDAKRCTSRSFGHLLAVIDDVRRECGSATIGL